MAELNFKKQVIPTKKGRSKGNKVPVGLAFSPYFIKTMDTFVLSSGFATRTELIERAVAEFIERERRASNES